MSPFIMWTFIWRRIERRVAPERKPWPLRLAASRPIRRETLKVELMRICYKIGNREQFRYRVPRTISVRSCEPRPRNRIHKNTDPCPSAVQKQMIQPLYPIFSTESLWLHIQDPTCDSKVRLLVFHRLAVQVPSKIPRPSSYKAVDKAYSKRKGVSNSRCGGGHGKLVHYP